MTFAQLRFFEVLLCILEYIYMYIYLHTPNILYSLP